MRDPRAPQKGEPTGCQRSASPQLSMPKVGSEHCCGRRDGTASVGGAARHGTEWHGTARLPGAPHCLSPSRCPCSRPPVAHTRAATLRALPAINRPGLSPALSQERGAPATRGSHMGPQNSAATPHGERGAEPGAAVVSMEKNTPLLGAKPNPKDWDTPLGAPQTAAPRTGTPYSGAPHNGAPHIGTPHRCILPQGHRAEPHSPSGCPQGARGTSIPTSPSVVPPPPGAALTCAGRRRLREGEGRRARARSGAGGAEPPGAAL